MMLLRVTQFCEAAESIRSIRSRSHENVTGEIRAIYCIQYSGAMHLSTKTYFFGKVFFLPLVSRTVRHINLMAAVRSRLFSLANSSMARRSSSSNVTVTFFLCFARWFAMTGELCLYNTAVQYTCQPMVAFFFCGGKPVQDCVGQFVGGNVAFIGKDTKGIW
jgi:hypothetical protein